MNAEKKGKWEPPKKTKTPKKETNMYKTNEARIRRRATERQG
jgi:hypothetical protein